MIKESGICENYEAIKAVWVENVTEKNRTMQEKNKRKVDSRIEGEFGLATDRLLNPNPIKSGAGC